MDRLRTLTVAQSMALIFLSGLAVAILFATDAVRGDLARRATLERDHALVAAAQETGTLIHALQRERGLTSAWLAAPVEALGREIPTQRGRTDRALAEVTGLDGAGLSAWLAELRGRADARLLSDGTYRDAMTVRNAALIAGLAEGASEARSGRVALLLGNVAALMAGKDAMGLERALGAKIAARREAGRAVTPEAVAELRAQILVRETWMAGFRLFADGEQRDMLDLWERSSAVRAFAAQRAALLDPDGATVGVTQWVAAADRVVDDLRAREVRATERLAEALEAERAEIGWEVVRRLLLLGGLIAVFGGLALWTLHRVDRSIRALIGTVCRLSVDAGSARVRACPQRDLNQISNALRILRSAQIERHRSIEAAEQMRSSVDEELDRVLGAVEAGAVDRRMDVLGLDAHGAVLARGVNRLLDQIERDRVAS